MYSLVLLMALNNGVEAPSYHNQGGCVGYVASYGCGHSSKHYRHGRGGCGGGYGGCYGGRGHGHHGRRGGCCGCYGGGYYGGCYGGGCYGGNYGGCYGYMNNCGNCGNCGYVNNCGCGGYFGGFGGQVMPLQQQGAPAQPQEKVKEMPKKETNLNVPSSATIVVNLPADAKVTIDGVATSSTSSERVFVTPELTPAKVFHYTLTAEIVRDGQTLTATKLVSVEAGRATTFTLEASSFAAALAQK